MPEAISCDYCGRDIPDEDIAGKTAGAWRGAMLCRACLPRARFARARRWFLGVAGAATLAFAAFLTTRDDAGPPATDPAGPEIVRTAPVDPAEEAASDLSALREEMGERLEALARMSTAGAEELAALAQEIDAVRGRMADFEARVARLEAAEPPTKGAVEPAPPSDPLLETVRRDLTAPEPRLRLAALDRLSELAPEKAKGLAPELLPLLSDAYGYVRREAARKAGELDLAALAPALLARLDREDDFLVRDQICRSLAAITGIPYDPLAHTGEMLDRQIERWRIWTQSR